MKKGYIFLLLIPILLFGWRGAGWRSGLSFPVNFEFLKSLTIGDDLYVTDTSFLGGAVVCSSTVKIIGDLTTTSDVWITGDTTKIVAYTIIGDAGNEGHLTPANDDLFIAGKLEVDNSAYFDGSAFYYSSMNLADNTAMVFGASTDAALKWSTDQTTETMLLALGSTAKSLVLTELAYVVKDHDHAAQTNATLFIHSSCDPDDDNTQWISIHHDSTNGVIDVGTGSVVINGVGQFAYVDLDIDDTEEYELTKADGKAGWGMASLEDEWTFFRFTAAGVVTLVNETANVGTTDGTDNKFNIFDSGSTITFENQLGNNKELNINVWFTP